MIPEQASCPDCNEKPTDESILRSKLSDLGYEHEDVFLECSNNHKWTVGIPVGVTKSKDWICPCCEGNLMPHFVYAVNKSIFIRPKCQSCYYVPDEKIEIDTKVSGAQLRGLVGHHTVTGKRETAKDMEF